MSHDSDVVIVNIDPPPENDPLGHCTLVYIDPGQLTLVYNDPGHSTLVYNDLGGHCTLVYNDPPSVQ